VHSIKNADGKNSGAEEEEEESEVEFESLVLP
jgi:hypothetical protein